MGPALPASSVSQQLLGSLVLRFEHVGEVPHQSRGEQETGHEMSEVKQTEQIPHQQWTMIEQKSPQPLDHKIFMRYHEKMSQFFFETKRNQQNMEIYGDINKFMGLQLQASGHAMTLDAHP